MRKYLSLIALASICAFMSFTASTKAADDNKDAKTTEKGSIKVTVMGEDGKPAADVAVQIAVRAPRRGQQQQTQSTAPGDNGNAGNTNQEQPRRRQPPVAKGMTDDKGVCTLSDVPVGDYTLSARKDDLRATKRVKIKAGDNDAVELTLKKQAPRRNAGQGQNK